MAASWTAAADVVRPAAAATAAGSSWGGGPAAAPAATSKAAPPAGAAAAGAIRGVVIDETAPVRPVAGQPVRLDVVERGSTSTRDTRTDARGRFVFSGLPVGGLRVFRVRVTYGGIPYSARAVLASAAPVRDVRLAVFEPTHDRSVVRGTVAFAVVEPVRGGALRVSVIQRFQNRTDRAVAVTEKTPLVFPLPRGAEAVQFIGGWRSPRVATGAITDALPVLPGVTAVAYAYGLEPHARSATVPWTFPYGAADVEILVADPSVRVSGTGVRADGSVTNGGRRYARWSGGPVPPGGGVAVRLDGLRASQDRWPVIAAGALAAALAAGLAVALRRRPAPA